MRASLSDGSNLVRGIVVDESADVGGLSRVGR